MQYISMLDVNALPNLAPDVLRTFVAAAQTGSFTRAGAEVCRTQSAVSMQIKKLESDLKRPLFVRANRAIELTPDGEMLLGYARQLLRLHDEAVGNFLRPEVAGVVRLGVPDDYAVWFLPHILGRIGRGFPHLQVDVQVDTSWELVRKCAQDDLDLCLTTGDGSVQVKNEAVVEHCLGKIPLVWTISRGVNLEEIWPAEQPLPLAVFHTGCLHRKWAVEALEAKCIPYRIAAASVSYAAVLAAVRSGYAVAPVTLPSVPTDCIALDQHQKHGLPSLPSITTTLHTRKETERPELKCVGQIILDFFSVFCSDC